MTRDEEWHVMVGQLAQRWMADPGVDEEAVRSLSGYIVRNLWISRPTAHETTHASEKDQ